MRKKKKDNWNKVNILKSQNEKIKKILKNTGDFSSVSQFVVFAVRKELGRQEVQ